MFSYVHVIAECTVTMCEWDGELVAQAFATLTLDGDQRSGEEL